jgi:hypothetical protein
MENIREAIEACLEEMPVAGEVTFIGVRDLTKYVCLQFLQFEKSNEP